MAAVTDQVGVSGVDHLALFEAGFLLVSEWFVDDWFLLGDKTSNSIVILMKLISEMCPHIELLLEDLLSDGHLALIVLFDSSSLSTDFTFESNVFLSGMFFQ